MLNEGRVRNADDQFGIDEGHSVGRMCEDRREEGSLPTVRERGEISFF